MPDLPDTAIAFAFDAGQQRRLERILNGTPFAAGLRGAPLRNLLGPESRIGSADQLLTMLEHLQQRLVDHARTYSATEASYHALLADRAAVRRWLGDRLTGRLHDAADEADTAAADRERLAAAIYDADTAGPNRLADWDDCAEETQARYLAMADAALRAARED